ncbi:hypothetical protein KSS87_009133 [Heliosperma pusillum]|nr:hypothetical protein KSS87_009133 [Heliosperma pusillum]
MDVEELSKFLGWAVSTALLLDSRQPKRQMESSYFTMGVEKPKVEDSISATLIRWLVASVILQSVSVSLGGSTATFFKKGGKEETLLSFMKHIKSGDGESNLCSDHRGILAANIFHLLQRLGMNYRVLPSAIAALSILLSDRFENSEGESGSPSHINSLMSKISYPQEANPAWKWSFQEPWADQTETDADSDRMDEVLACQKLLVKFLEIMENKSLIFSLPTHCELEA